MFVPPLGAMPSSRVAIVSRLVAIVSRLVAIVSRLVAIVSRLVAIVSRLVATLRPPVPIVPESVASLSPLFEMQGCARRILWDWESHRFSVVSFR